MLRSLSLVPASVTRTNLWPLRRGAFSIDIRVPTRPFRNIRLHQSPAETVHGESAVCPEDHFGRQAHVHRRVSYLITQSVGLSSSCEHRWLLVPFGSFLGWRGVFLGVPLERQDTLCDMDPENARAAEP